MGFTLFDLATYASAAVGVASALVRAADAIANVTPTTVDDEFVGKAKRGLGWVVKFLDRVALNPPAAKARESK